MQQRTSVYISNIETTGNCNNEGCLFDISEGHQGDSKEGQEIPESSDEIIKKQLSKATAARCLMLNIERNNNSNQQKTPNNRKKTIGLT